MKRQEVISGVLLLLLATAYLVYNRQYEVGTLALPGAGVFPLAVGLFTLAMSGLHVLIGLKGGKPVAAVPAGGRNGGKAWLLVALVVVFLLFINTLGFFTMSFLLVTACGKLLGIKEWPKALGLGVGATIGAYLIFKIWLNVPLPKGLFL
ncbi:MAG: tripartite tricarboxylate transporter TctB family protein [Syntrophothermus sp.]